MHHRSLRIGIVAGESSGDLLGGRLIEAFKSRYPDAQFIGIGGSKMIAAGCQSLYPQEKLAVRGLVEVLKHLPELSRLRRGLIQQLQNQSLDLFIGIDAPDFNFGIEKVMKKSGIPTIHYVSPSVWAWRLGRVKKIIEIADLVLCLFPMEPELYQQAGGKAVFVGHPLAQSIPLENNLHAMREMLKIEPSRKVITLMPGSRVGEVDELAPIFLETARQLSAQYPDILFLLPVATVATRVRVLHWIEKLEMSDLPLRLMSGHAQEAIIASDAVLVASGTATLEVALCKRPMVVAYKISSFTFALLKMIVKIPYVSLPNILLKRFAVPELLQGKARPQNLAQEITQLLENPDGVAQLVDDFHQLHQTLRCDTDSLTTKSIESLISTSAQ